MFEFVYNMSANRFKVKFTTLGFGNRLMLNRFESVESNNPIVVCEMCKSKICPKYDSERCKNE